MALECRPLALNGRAGTHQICPLLKVDRPCHRAAVTSQFDPNRKCYDSLFDHLVGEQEERFRHCEAQRRKGKPLTHDAKAVKASRGCRLGDDPRQRLKKT
jgi:hypothetical protein